MSGAAPHGYAGATGSGRTMQTFLWHDYETFGADPRRDRPAQFGGDPHDARSRHRRRSGFDLLQARAGRAAFARRVPRHRHHAAARRSRRRRRSRVRRARARSARRTRHLRRRLQLAALRRRVHAAPALPQLLRSVCARMGAQQFALGRDRSGAHVLRACARTASNGPGAKTARRAFASKTSRARTTCRNAARTMRSPMSKRCLAWRASCVSAQPRLWDWHFALRRKQRVFELLDVVEMTPIAACVVALSIAAAGASR